MHSDVWHWTPKGETNGLSTLYIQKAYAFDVGDTVKVFCGRIVKISIIHNYNPTENLGAVRIIFRLLGGRGGDKFTDFGRRGGENSDNSTKKPYTPNFLLFFDGSTKFILVNLIFEVQKTKN